MLALPTNDEEAIVKEKKPIKSDTIEVEVINKRLGSLPPGMQLAVNKSEAAKLVKEGKVKAAITDNN